MSIKTKKASVRIRKTTSRRSTKKHPIHKHILHRLTQRGFTKPKIVPALVAVIFAGIGSYFLVFSKAAVDDVNPVYRWANTSTGHYFYKASTDTDQPQNQGYAQEGLVFNAWKVGGTGSVGIYRHANSTTGAHYYGPSSSPPAGFFYEGLVFYAYTTGGSDRVPVYQLYRASNGDYFYTTNPNDATSGYIKDAGYAYKPDSNPVFWVNPPNGNTRNDYLPRANIDSATCSNVQGWAFDIDKPANPLYIHVVVDGKTYETTTNLASSDVNKAYASYGVTGTHRFSYNLPAGAKNISVYAINMNSAGTSVGDNPLLKSLTCAGTTSSAPAPSSSGGTATASSKDPAGNVDAKSCTSVQGWAFDADSPATSLLITIYVDGSKYEDVRSSIARPDVNSQYGLTGNHGFSWTVPYNKLYDQKDHKIEVFALNVKTDGSLAGDYGNTKLREIIINCKTDGTGAANDSSPVVSSGSGSGLGGGTSTYTDPIAAAYQRLSRDVVLSKDFLGGSVVGSAPSNKTISLERQYLFANRTTAASRTTRSQELQLADTTSAQKILSYLFGRTKISACEKNGKYISAPGGESLGPNVFEGFSQYYSLERNAAISVSPDECRKTFGGTSKDIYQ